MGHKSSVACPSNGACDYGNVLRDCCKDSLVLLELLTLDIDLMVLFQVTDCVRSVGISPIVLAVLTLPIFV